MKIYCSQDISHRQYCVIFSSGEYFRENMICIVPWTICHELNVKLPKFILKSRLYLNTYLRKYCLQITRNDEQIIGLYLI